MTDDDFEDIDEELLPNTSKTNSRWWIGIVVGIVLHVGFLIFFNILSSRLPSSPSREMLRDELYSMLGGNSLLVGLVSVVVLGGIFLPPIAVAIDIYSIRSSSSQDSSSDSSTDSPVGSWTPPKYYYIYSFVCLLFVLPLLPVVASLHYLYLRYMRAGISF